MQGRKVYNEKPKRDHQIPHLPTSPTIEEFMKDYKPYRHTTVNYMRTQTKICELLRKYDIFDTRWTNLKDQVIFEFNKMVEIEDKERLAGVRLVIKGVNNENRNQLHRALFFYLKSKMEFLDFGFIEFLQEFMPHLILTNKSGQSITAYQLFKPQYQKGLLSGKGAGEVKMLPDYSN